MSVGFVLTVMVLTTEEKVFIVERYFRSYGAGLQNGPSLRHVREHYEEQFNKTSPSNKNYGREVPTYGINLVSTEENNWAPEDLQNTLNEVSAMFVVDYALGTVTLVGEVVHAVPMHLV